MHFQGLEPGATTPETLGTDHSSRGDVCSRRITLGPSRGGGGYCWEFVDASKQVVRKSFIQD